jgi:hypothetical protein
MKKGEPGQLKTGVHARRTNQMLLAFFDSEGLISVHIMPRGASINFIYIIKVLGNFMKWLKNKRPVLVDHAGLVFPLV